MKLILSRASSKGSMRPSSLKVSGGVVDVLASSGEGMPAVVVDDLAIM